ncbi:MAG: HAD-IIIA family hydrolase [Bacteroidetes bacterium]|nr:MAG: HAD-IIIA family hydrolase [Bacteroidota bacterium]
MRGGIFFDRDGTINEEVSYLSSPEQLRLIPRSAQAIHDARAAGFFVFIISNQAGVARGYLTEEGVEQINSSLLRMLQAEHATIDGIYYCPHHPELGEAPYRLDCDCRKPHIGMMLQAQREFGVDFSRSFVIGDKVSDIATANNAGAKGILVKTGYGREAMNLLSAKNVTPAYIAEDAFDAVQFITRNYPQQ